MKIRNKKLIVVALLMLFASNSFSGIFGGGGGGSSDYWQMKTYFENVAINAQTLKSANYQLDQINHMIEQAKKMPDQYFKDHMKQYNDMVNTLTKITNNTKSVLKDAKKGEMWFKDVYSDVKNKNYETLLDKFTTSLDNLSYDSMKTAGLATEANRKTANNAKTLIQKAKSAENPVQLLEVLSAWSSNLSTQLGTITEVLASDSRLKALDEAEKAQQRKIAQERHKYTQDSLDKTIKKMGKINGKK
jgi:hypothetical protein